MLTPSHTLKIRPHHLDRLALIYVRQSRNRPGERTDSPEIQEAMMRSHPAVAGCSSVEVLSDLDLSGGNRKESLIDLPRFFRSSTFIFTPAWSSI